MVDGEAVLVVNDGCYQVGIGWKWLELVGWLLRDAGSDWEWTQMVWLLMLVGNDKMLCDPMLSVQWKVPWAID